MFLHKTSILYKPEVPEMGASQSDVPYCHHPDKAILSCQIELLAVT